MCFTQPRYRFASYYEGLFFFRREDTILLLFSDFPPVCFRLLEPGSTHSSQLLPGPETAIVVNNNTSYHPYLRRVLLHSYDYDYNYE